MNLFTKKSVFSKGSYRVKHVDGLLERRQQGLVELNYEVKMFSWYTARNPERQPQFFKRIFVNLFLYHCEDLFEIS